jgi:Leucine-rich repeat (LRR) protein
VQSVPAAGNTFSRHVTKKSGEEIWGYNRQYNCGCRDADLVEIAKLSNLRWLLLDANPVTDKGVESLTALQKLEHLGLEHTMVTDEGVRSIETLPRLQTLNLSRTDITNECVEILGQCKQLNELDVSQTHLDDEDVARLRKLLPNCEVKK